MKAKGLSWYWNRLKAMNVEEIMFRVSLLIKKKVWKITKPNYQPSCNFDAIDHGTPITNLKIHDQANGYIKQVVEEADLYLKHKWIFFDLEEVEPQLNWHLDPKSQIEAPLSFGFDINHRDEKLVGNIKNTWEKNRHHHLTILALAFFLTKEEKYAKEVEGQLQHWIEQNPYLIGVNWTHPLEQGIRLISWVYIAYFLKDSKTYENIFGNYGFIWNSVFEHQKFIVETYSRGSSANNHLIGEMAGLFISACCWPIFKQSKKWKSLALRILEKELLNQTYPDGVNKELAFSYQIFVLEFSMLSLMADPASFSTHFRNILQKKCNVAYQLSSIIGYEPNYGDGDEGMALQIQPLKADRISWLLSLSNKLLETNYEVKPNLPHFLFSCPTLQNNTSIADSFVSKAAGLLAKKWRSAGRQFATMADFGPLGMGSLAAHGHADALSFVLTVDDKPIIIDTGTYCYHDNLEWRAYFRSVHAHNTVSINGEDQSEQTGPFLWGKRAVTELLQLDKETTTMTARHDGYQKRYGVIHQRKIDFQSDGISITDKLEGDGDQKVEIRFHFHPDIVVELSENRLLIPEESLFLEFDSKLEAKLLRGEPNGGWYSPSFGSKAQTHTLVLSQVLSLPVELPTRIKTID